MRFNDLLSCLCGAAAKGVTVWITQGVSGDHGAPKRPDGVIDLRYRETRRTAHDAVNMFRDQVLKLASWSLRQARQSFEMTRRLSRSKLDRPVVPLTGLTPVWSDA
jgi:hypothetical protein